MTLTTSPPNNHSGLNINQAVIDNSVVHTNVGQEIVVTTEDKLELCLRDYQDILKAKNDWKTPAGLLLAFLTSLVAAEFKEFLGLNSEMWKSIFIIGSFLCFGWLVKASIIAYKHRNSGNIKKIIQILKNNTPNITS